VLNKPRDELKPPLTLGAPKLVLVVRGRVQVSSERVEGPEGSVAYVTLIRSTIEGRRESDNEARGGAASGGAGRAPINSGLAEMFGEICMALTAAVNS